MHKEDQLVEKIARAVPSILGHRAPGALRLGIGDDSAILSPGGRNDWVLSCDAFLEGVHFLAKAHPADSVGYKSLVRAASDLVAMGASPKYFLMTLALPAFRIGTWLDAFLAGMGRAARYLGNAPHRRGYNQERVQSRSASPCSVRSLAAEQFSDQVPVRATLFMLPESWVAPSLAWNLCERIWRAGAEFENRCGSISTLKSR